MRRIKKIDYSKNFKDLDKLADSIGERGDCAAKAIAIACDVEYSVVASMLEVEGRKKGQGTYDYQMEKVIKKLGFKISRVSLELMISRYPGHHKSLKNVTSHHPRRFPDVWANMPTAIFKFSRHVAAFKGGEIHDWSVNKSLHVIAIWKIEKI